MGGQSSTQAPAVSLREIIEHETKIQRLRAELERERDERKDERRRLRAELDRGRAELEKLLGIQRAISESTNETGSKSSDHSDVSMKSDCSKDLPLKFKSTDETGSKSSDHSDVSMKSDCSKDLLLKFKSTNETGSKSLDSGCVSMKSDRSKDLPLFFKSTDETGSKSSDLSCVSMKSDRSKDLPLKFKSHDETSETGGKRDLGSIFQLVKENTVSFVKTQLKWCQKVLSTDSPDILRWLCGENEEADKKIWRSRDAFLTITLDFMRTMNLGDLADSLQNKLNFIVRGTSADISEASSQRDRQNRSFMTIIADYCGNRLKKRKD
ncbi:uncharacterized protein LOC121513172 isoform X2 [Cheilinus undulatus]|uniref:uncharacterized protein LOC121513172 isoform X2 n=1 Tax=Cheilinus undulatus TaxID=241271 RepID=UPI001BD2007D|nr:uncharacterized protein LOC121513172 isoform X2 [Cheilinus undulatus]